ncbi:MAG: hypothetical protein U1U88_002267 [Lawsonella clevelandensis]
MVAMLASLGSLGIAIAMAVLFNPGQGMQSPNYTSGFPRLTPSTRSVWMVSG